MLKMEQLSLNWVRCPSEEVSNSDSSLCKGRGQKGLRRGENRHASGFQRQFYGILICNKIPASEGRFEVCIVPLLHRVRETSSGVV